MFSTLYTSRGIVGRKTILDWGTINSRAAGNTATDVRIRWTKKVGRAGWAGTLGDVKSRRRRWGREP